MYEVYSERRLSYIETVASGVGLGAGLLQIKRWNELSMR